MRRAARVDENQPELGNAKRDLSQLGKKLIGQAKPEFKTIICDTEKLKIKK